MEKHLLILKHTCRVCGGYFPSDLNAEIRIINGRLAKEMKTVLCLDTEEDFEQMHPKSICSKCRIKVSIHFQATQKRKKSGINLRAVTFAPHDEQCELCSQTIPVMESNATAKQEGPMEPEFDSPRKSERLKRKGKLSWGSLEMECDDEPDVNTKTEAAIKCEVSDDFDNSSPDPEMPTSRKKKRSSATDSRTSGIQGASGLPDHSNAAYCRVLCETLHSLQQRDLLCDLTLKGKDGIVMAHSVIMMAACPGIVDEVGKSVFPCVDLSSWTKATISQALLLCYTGKSNDNGDSMDTSLFSCLSFLGVDISQSIRCSNFNVSKGFSDDVLKSELTLDSYVGHTEETTGVDDDPTYHPTREMAGNSHPSHVEDPAAFDNTDIFTCSRCNKTYVNKRFYLKHSKLCRSTSTFHRSGQRGVSGYTCKVCRKRYATHWYYTKHLQSGDCSLRRKALHLCSICGRKFKHQTTRENHGVKCRGTFVDREGYLKHYRRAVTEGGEEKTSKGDVNTVSSSEIAENISEGAQQSPHDVNEYDSALVKCEETDMIQDNSPCGTGIIDSDQKCHTEEENEAIEVTSGRRSKRTKAREQIAEMLTKSGLQKKTVTSNQTSTKDECKYECGTCEKRFIYKGSYEKHVSLNLCTEKFPECGDFTGPFRCLKCQLLFKQQYAYLSHVAQDSCSEANSVYQSKQEAELALCEKDPEDEINVTDDVSKSPETKSLIKKQLTCKICQKRFVRKGSALKHYNLCKLKADDKPRNVNSKHALSDADAQHQDEDDKFDSSYVIRNVMKRGYVECGKVNFERDAINLYNVRVRRQPKCYEKAGCSLCGVTLFDEPALYRHLVQIHSIIYPFQCKLCDKLYPSRRTVLLHLEDHRLAAEEGRDVTNVRLKVMKCWKCNVNIENEDVYREHVTACDGRMLCPHCGVHIRQRGLDHHIKVHHNELKDKCTVCGALVSFGSLNRHMQTHTKELKHFCSTCGKGFARRDNLRAHEMLHSGVRPHTCADCGHGFMRKKQLEQHACQAQTVQYEIYVTTME